MSVTTPSHKTRTQFVCSECGGTTPRWEGRCPSCGEWNTLAEALAPRTGTAHARRAVPASTTTRLDAVEGRDAARIPTGTSEVDRVLGGGIVPGSLILLGGDPGIGKSTLALQIADQVGSDANPTLYCAGEESAAQLGMRAQRLGRMSSRIDVLPETDLDALVATIAARMPVLAIVDSVQTIIDTQVAGTPGSPSQVRSAVARLMACAKETGVCILLIGHVTKEGAIAGPRTLEHMVDVVLYLEGERHGDHRLLRGVKNRFGSTGELGLFEMVERGMCELDAPGRAFLDETSLGIPGNALTVLCEGSRPLAVEVQSLTIRTSFGTPRRTASGFDLGRLHLLLAVLERRANVGLSETDVYVNAVGGVRLIEPAADLAVALAVAGSRLNVAVPDDMVVIGEVGLGGEVRRVRRLDARLAEARQLGITSAIVPAGSTASVPGMTVRQVSRIGEAIALLGSRPTSD